MTDFQTLKESELSPDPSPGQGSEPATALAAVARRPTDLVPRDVVSKLSVRSDAVGGCYFLAHYGLIGVGAWLTWVTFPGVWFVPCLAVHALILGFLFSPLHECAHGTAFKTRWLNETALWITAVVYVVPPYFFRYFHLGHHRYTQVAGKDPSMVLPEPATFGQYLWYCAGLWFWWRNLSWITKHAVGRVDPASANYVPKQRLSMMVVEARIMALLYGSILALAAFYGYLWILILCWLLPRFIGEPVQRIIRVAEHVGCAENSNLLENTRTTISNKWLHALAWQMPYHAEHHLFPNLPFHQLPKLHPWVKAQIVVEPRGYLAGQRDIISMLRQPGRKLQGNSRLQQPII